ncbi:MAG: FHA domain-containing protein, partial [Bdellovibrionota bacterium]
MNSTANKIMQLELEHHYKNKFLGRHAISPKGNVMVLGSSPTAHVRLLGSDVGEVHAYLEYADGQWYIIDAGSEKGTWVQKHPIVREMIESEMTVAIGGHQLKFHKRAVETSLFNAKKLEKSEPVTKTGTTLYHQMIIKKHNVTYKTELAPMTQFFTFVVGDKAHQFSPPKGEGEVLENKIGDFTFIQRLVRSNTAEMTVGNYVHELMHSDVRRPLITAIGFMTLALVVFLAMPSKPQEELVTPELDQNKFTRMILDAKLMKQKRTEARERQKQLERAPSSGQGVASTEKTPSMTTPTPTKGATPKVISKLKTQGLTALLSKISS